MTIPGWFDYAAFWDAAIASAPSGATLVEVGVFCGKSLAHIAREAKAANKGLRVVGVDSFGGSPEHLGQASNLNELPPFTLAQLCCEFLSAAGVLDDVTLIRSDSAKAAQWFADGSVWAVFIDADHSEEGVTRDIRAWRPKVAKGGWLGGDDYYTFPGVKAAVDREFGGAALVPGCWWQIEGGAG